MAYVTKRPAWHIPERLLTPERAFLHRREFLREFGLAGAGLLSATLVGCSRSSSVAAESTPAPPPSPALPRPAVAPGQGYPAPRHPQFNPPWKLTDEKVAACYNNFYEFTTVKDRVHRLVDRFQITPWPVEIGGLVEKPMTVDVEELIQWFGLEERIYRFRCVEAWAMIVPWTGFPLAKLLEKVQPKPEAKFVRFVTFFRPKEAPGFADDAYPWPYTEGLRLDEALHPLTMLVTGIYGHALPRQHGAPIRLIVPWKYGYKSIKSIVKIELTATQPATLWETLLPGEYPFESNVDPAVPHPRWSQATERLIDTGERVRTKPYNGYGELLAKLYPKA
jgi:sulfoxide reductase catalytic subunit YedY